MAKLQLIIEDGTSAILDKLSRRSDKALFVEIAIKKAYANPKIRELFGWVDEESPKTKKVTKGKKPDDTSETSGKVTYDNDFK